MRLAKLVTFAVCMTKTVKDEKAKKKVIFSENRLGLYPSPSTRT